MSLELNFFIRFVMSFWALSGASALGAAEPMVVLGESKSPPKPAIVGLASLPDNRHVLIQDRKGLSTLELATGKITGRAKLDPFPDDVAVKLARDPAITSHRGSLTVLDDGKTAFLYDALGVYEYALPLASGPKKRVENRGTTIAPILGIAHVDTIKFPFCLNSRGDLFEGRYEKEKADSMVGMVKVQLSRIRIDRLYSPLPAIASGGRYVAVGGSDGRVLVYDTTTMTALFPIPVEQEIAALGVAKDGKTLSVISFSAQPPSRGPRVQLFSLPEGKEVAAWPTTGRRLAFSPDGASLAVLDLIPSAKRGRLELRNARTGAIVHAFETPMDFINCFDFTPDGKSLIAGGDSGSLYQWSTESGKPVVPPATPPAYVSSAGFLDDGGWWTVEASGQYRTWAKDGKNEKSLTSHDGAAVHAVRSHNGKFIFTSGSIEDRTIRKYDAESGKELARLRLSTPNSVATRLAPSPDGKHLYAGVAFEGIHRIEIDSFTILGTLKPSNPSPASAGGATNEIAFTADSTMVSRDYDRFRVWDLKDDREILNYSYPRAGRINWVLASQIAAAPTGRKYVVRSGASTQSLSIHERDKSTLAGVVAITNTDYHPFTSLTFVSESIAAAGCPDGRILLVDLNKKKTEGVLLGKHLEAVTCLSVSPDGQHLISGSADGSAKVWKLP